jgi:hypothetical protein
MTNQRCNFHNAEGTEEEIEVMVWDQRGRAQFAVGTFVYAPLATLPDLLHLGRFVHSPLVTLCDLHNPREVAYSLLITLPPD